MGTNKSFETVFLIDDNEIDIFIQKRYIELSSFASQIITYNSPTKALEAFNRDHAKADINSAGLIFLDLNMPILNGFEFLEQLNGLSADFCDKFKVVILSSSNSEEDRKRAHEFPNVISFTSKPISVDELQNIATMLNK